MNWNTFDPLAVLWKIAVWFLIVAFAVAAVALFVVGFWGAGLVYAGGTLIILYSWLAHG